MHLQNFRILLTSETAEAITFRFKQVIKHIFICMVSTLCTARKIRYVWRRTSGRKTVNTNVQTQLMQEYYIGDIV